MDAANANIPSHRFTIDDKYLAEIDDSLADGFVVRVDDVLQRAFRLEADGKTIDVVERGRFKDPSAPSFTACAVFIDDDCRLKVTQLRSEADESSPNVVTGHRVVHGFAGGASRDPGTIHVEVASEHYGG